MFHAENSALSNITPITSAYNLVTEITKWNTLYTTEYGMKLH